MLPFSKVQTICHSKKLRRILVSKQRIEDLSKVNWLIFNYSKEQTRSLPTLKKRIKKTVYLCKKRNIFVIK